MMKDFHDYSLFRHNTFGMNVKCSRFVEFSSIEDLRSAVRVLNFDDPLLILGGGSNILFVDDFAGTVIHSRIKGLEIVEGSENDKYVYLRCGSGEAWDDVVSYAVTHEMYGAENLSGIPGEVGASVVQNIGAYGVEVKEFVDSIEAMEIKSGALCRLLPEDCNYGYRDSKFKREWANRYIITHVTYRFSKAFEPRLDYGNIRSFLESKGVMRPSASCLRETILHIRNAKLPDPKVLGNAGSFFVNPVVDKEKLNSLQVEYPEIPHYLLDDGRVKIPAAWLIEQCGWKGRTLGRAGVYERQPLVLVNCGGATGDEVMTLCNTIRADVHRKFGLEIKPEVIVV